MEFRKVVKLLSIESDAKSVKGNKRNWLTGVLYLSPSNLSGFQVCPKASEGCKLACLNTAGRGVYDRTQLGRINKTKWFFLDRQSFMDSLVKNIKRLENRASKRKMKPAVRLNGTSDIAWEKIKCIKDGIEYRNLMQAFPKIQFYDYTKILSRSVSHIRNYHLTFSMSENNDREVVKAIEMGYNVSVVMRLGRNDPKPELWNGYNVIDGDKDDLRFLDKKGGNIIALFPKGKAKHDIHGFVKELDYKLVA